MYRRFINRRRIAEIEMYGVMTVVIEELLLRATPEAKKILLESMSRESRRYKKKWQKWRGVRTR